MYIILTVVVKITLTHQTSLNIDDKGEKMQVGWIEVNNDYVILNLTNLQRVYHHGYSYNL